MTASTAKLEDFLDIRAWAKDGPDGDPDWSTVVFADECPGEGYRQVVVSIGGGDRAC